MLGEYDTNLFQILQLWLLKDLLYDLWYHP